MRTLVQNIPNAPTRVSAKATRHRGFTLIELLTVIAVIAVLAAILAPSLSSVMAKVRMTKSQSNLHSIGQAFAAYAADHNDLLPAPQAGSSGGSGRTSVGSPNLSNGPWLVEIAEYLDGSIIKLPDGSYQVRRPWPSALQCPEYYSKNGGIDDQFKRGYGMNIYPYRADIASPKRNTPYNFSRQAMSDLPNPSNNVIVATSNDVIINPGTDGHFQRAGTEYADGDPARFNGLGLFLMLDGSVQTWDADQAAQALSVPLNLQMQP